MTDPQIVAGVICRLSELGLDFEQVKTASVAIIPAVIEVGGDIERNINISCGLFAEQMKK